MKRVAIALLLMLCAAKGDALPRVCNIDVGCGVERCTWELMPGFIAAQALYSDWSEIEFAVFAYQNSCTGRIHYRSTPVHRYCPDPSGPCIARDLCPTCPEN
jgi:hypothetical protein